MRETWSVFLSRQGVALLVASVILVVATFLRLAGLESFPMMINQDELTIIYDGYSIATTGADRFGHRFPVVLSGFGSADFRPALAAWLISLPSLFTGFSVAAGRGVSGVLGVASLVLLFLLARRVFSERFALVALLLGALSPWHTLFSRMAHEGAILPAFFAVAITYVFVRAHDSGYSGRLLALVGFLCGFSTNAYQGTRVTGGLYTLLVLFALTRHCELFTRRARFAEYMRKGLIVGGAAILGASPQIFILMAQPEQFLRRARCGARSGVFPGVCPRSPYEFFGQPVP